MTAALLSSYIAQMRAVVEAEQPAENWRLQFGKLADLALWTAERMSNAEHQEPDLFHEP